MTTYEVYCTLDELQAAINRPCEMGQPKASTESGYPYIHFALGGQAKAQVEQALLLEIKRQISLCIGPTGAVVRSLPESWEPEPGKAFAIARIAFEPITPGDVQ